MYERSAIVLERYFENLLDYRREFNLRDNFNNYCELIEKLDKFQLNYQKEVAATESYNESLRKIKSIQLAQEKLYKKSAKMEYSRNLLFSNVDGKVDDTRKCIEKIEADVEKNIEAMKENKENLLQAMTEFNDRKFDLSKCKRYKKMAENEYNEIYEVAYRNFQGISADNIGAAKSFAKFDDSENIIETLDKNGKDEKIPFNEGVIESATTFGIEVAKKEVLSYLVIYDKMGKLLNEIANGSARIELHKKYARNEKAKVDFILASKDYMSQFLDYERMTIIHGRKSHNRLMCEACENFNTDVIQINNLFELLVREITNKATKKAYKELYNKSYIKDIKNKEEKFKKEKNRVNLNTATLINSNYWRIDGIKNIYTVFYRNVSEVFGKEVAEFEIPQDTDDDTAEESPKAVKAVEDEKPKNDDIIEVEKPKVPMPFSISENQDDDEDDESDDETMGSNYDEYDDFDDEIEENDETSEDEKEYTSYDAIEEETESAQNISVNDDFDIFGEKYQETDFIEKNVLEAKRQVEEEEEYKAEIKKAKIKRILKAENNIGKEAIFSNEEDDIPYEVEDEEEALFGNVKIQKSDKKSKIEDFDLEKEEKNSNGILKKLRKISSVKKTNQANNIW